MRLSNEGTDAPALGPDPRPNRVTKRFASGLCLFHRDGWKGGLWFLRWSYGLSPC